MGERLAEVFCVECEALDGVIECPDDDAEQAMLILKLGRLEGRCKVCGGCLTARWMGGEVKGRGEMSQPEAS